MRKIYYIHQHYIDPKDQWGGSRSHEFAKRLASRNYEVIIISTDKQRIFKVPQIINSDYGYKICKIATPYSNNFPYLVRSLFFALFSLKAFFFLLIKSNKSDLIFATSTPLTVGIPALLLKIFKGNKYIFEVRDLWPEMPISLGIIKSKILKYLLFKMEEIIYSNAEHVIFCSNDMERTSTNKYPWIKSKVSVIENSCDPYFLKKKVKNLNMNDLKLCYFGSLGILNNMEYWIDFLKILIVQYQFRKITLDIYGGGKTLKSIQNKISKENLNNFINLKGNLNKSEVFKIMREYDFSICSFLPIPEMSKNSSNKFFDAISSNVPILINYGGWQKELISKYNIGISINSDSRIGASQFAEAIRNFVPSSDGFEVLKNRFSRESHFLKLINIIKNI